MVDNLHKLRFWSQKVLPLVYDESLSYYEVLGKVTKYLNDTIDVVNVLIEYFNNYSAEIEAIIEQMLEDGDFDDIIADVLGSLVAKPYDETKQYLIFDYCIYEGTLYRANGSTTGTFNPEKWDEKVLSDDISVLENRVYSLNAGNVSYNSSTSYDSGTVGNAISELNTLNTNKILYFQAQNITAASNAEILRIEDPRINATTVVLEFQVVDPDKIKSSINWTSSNDGYISFTGTCSSATLGNITLGNR